MLEDHADALAHAAQFGPFQRGEVHPVHLHPAGIRPFQAVDTADQGALAGAAHPDDAVDLAGAHLQIDAPQGLDPPVFRSQIPCGHPGVERRPVRPAGLPPGAWREPFPGTRPVLRRPGSFPPVAVLRRSRARSGCRPRERPPRATGRELEEEKGLFPSEEAAPSALISPGNPAGIGTAHPRQGCRLPGFIGPVPPPLWMKAPQKHYAVVARRPETVTWCQSSRSLACRQLPGKVAEKSEGWTGGSGVMGGGPVARRRRSLANRE